MTSNTITHRHYLTADYITEIQLGKTTTFATAKYDVLLAGRTIVDHDIPRHCAGH